MNYCTHPHLIAAGRLIGCPDCGLGDADLKAGKQVYPRNPEQNYLDASNIYKPSYTQEQIKELLLSQKQHIVSALEGMKRGEFGIEGTPFYGSLEARKQSRVHNQAIDDAISLIEKI